MADKGALTPRQENRQKQRFPVMEFGMLWRPNGQVPDRVGPAVITNVSLGGVQFKAKHDFQPSEELYLELATDDGPILLPGDVRYALPDGNGSATYGFRFQPRTKPERQAAARWVLSLSERQLVEGF